MLFWHHLLVPDYRVISDFEWKYRQISDKIAIYLWSAISKSELWMVGNMLRREFLDFIVCVWIQKFSLLDDNDRKHINMLYTSWIIDDWFVETVIKVLIINEWKKLFELYKNKAWNFSSILSIDFERILCFSFINDAFSSEEMKIIEEKLEYAWVSIDEFLQNHSKYVQLSLVEDYKQKLLNPKSSSLTRDFVWV